MSHYFTYVLIITHVWSFSLIIHNFISMIYYVEINSTYAFNKACIEASPRPIGLGTAGASPPVT